MFGDDKTVLSVGTFGRLELVYLVRISASVCKNSQYLTSRLYQEVQSNVFEGAVCSSHRSKVPCWIILMRPLDRFECTFSMY